MSLSKELFGIEKLTITKEENTRVRGYEDGYNKCVYTIDQFELNEEELDKILCDVYPYSDMPTMKRYAKAIKENQSKIFVRKNEKTS